MSRSTAVEELDKHSSTKQQGKCSLSGRTVPQSDMPPAKEPQT